MLFIENEIDPLDNNFAIRSQNNPIELNEATHTAMDIITENEPSVVAGPSLLLMLMLMLLHQLQNI